MSNSGLLRLQEHTPSAYTNDSRDFQLMLRVYDCVNNGVKYYIDSIIDSLNTDLCNSELLGLLKTKVGFFSSSEFTDREARYILKSLPYIMKYKGSKAGIEQAVRVFMVAEGISASSDVFIDTEKHEIEIFIESELVGAKMLEEMLKYIIPTGYIVSITFGNPNETNPSHFQEDAFGMALSMPDLYNSVVRGSVAPNIDTDGVSPDNSVYYGFRAVETPLSPTIAKYAYEISGTPSITSGNMSEVTFVAKEDAPHIYSSSSSWTSVYDSGNSEWVWQSDSQTVSSGIKISDGTTPASASISGSDNPQNICLYNGTNAWTNVEFNALGDVGFTDVLGSENDDSGTPASYTF